MVLGFLAGETLFVNEDKPFIGEDEEWYILERILTLIKSVVPRSTRNNAPASWPLCSVMLPNLVSPLPLNQTQHDALFLRTPC